MIADDLVLVTEKEEDMKRNVEVLNEVMTKWKMKINWEKTKVLVVQRGGGTCHIVVDGVEVEDVQTAKYLGVMFNEEESCNHEIENRMEDGKERDGEKTLNDFCLYTYVCRTVYIPIVRN